MEIVKKYHQYLTLVPKLQNIPVIYHFLLILSFTMHTDAALMSSFESLLRLSGHISRLRNVKMDNSNSGQYARDRQAREGNWENLTTSASDSSTHQNFIKTESVPINTNNSFSTTSTTASTTSITTGNSKNNSITSTQPIIQNSKNTLPHLVQQTKCKAQIPIDSKLMQLQPWLQYIDFTTCNEFGDEAPTVSDFNEKQHILFNGVPSEETTANTERLPVHIALTHKCTSRGTIDNSIEIGDVDYKSDPKPPLSQPSYETINGKKRTFDETRVIPHVKDQSIKSDTHTSTCSATKTKSMKKEGDIESKKVRDVELEVTTTHVNINVPSLCLYRVHANQVKVENRFHGHLLPTELLQHEIPDNQKKLSTETLEKQKNPSLYHVSKQIENPSLHFFHPALNQCYDDPDYLNDTEKNNPDLRNKSWFDTCDSSDLCFVCYESVKESDMCISGGCVCRNYARKPMHTACLRRMMEFGKIEMDKNATIPEFKYPSYILKCGYCQQPQLGSGDVLFRDAIRSYRQFKKLSPSQKQKEWLDTLGMIVEQLENVVKMIIKDWRCSHSSYNPVLASVLGQFAVVSSEVMYLSTVDFNSTNPMEADYGRYVHESARDNTVRLFLLAFAETGGSYIYGLGGVDWLFRIIEWFAEDKIKHGKYKKNNDPTAVFIFERLKIYLVNIMQQTYCRPLQIQAKEYYQRMLTYCAKHEENLYKVLVDYLNSNKCNEILTDEKETTN